MALAVRVFRSEQCAGMILFDSIDPLFFPMLAKATVLLR